MIKQSHFSIILKMLNEFYHIDVRKTLILLVIFQDGHLLDWRNL